MDLCDRVHIDPMTNSSSGGSAHVSFLIWIAEVDAVAAEIIRIGFARGERVLALGLRNELEVARDVAQDRLLARKAFHFVPSAAVAWLAKDAIQSARRHPPDSLGAPSQNPEPGSSPAG